MAVETTTTQADESPQDAWVHWQREGMRERLVLVPHRRSASPRVSPERVNDYLKEILGDDVHAARVLSFSRGVVGVLHAAALGIHAIGRGMADALGLHPKHAIKQVDRLLSNAGITVWAWFTS